MTERKKPVAQVHASSAQAFTRTEIPKSTQFALYMLDRLVKSEPIVSYKELDVQGNMAPSLSIRYDDLSLTQFIHKNYIDFNDEMLGLNELAIAVVKVIGHPRTGILAKEEVIQPFASQGKDGVYSPDMRPEIGLAFTANHTPQEIRERIHKDRHLIRGNLVDGDALSNLVKRDQDDPGMGRA